MYLDHDHRLGLRVLQSAHVVPNASNKPYTALRISPNSAHYKAAKQKSHQSGPTYQDKPSQPNQN